MIVPKDLYDQFLQEGISYFAGVPDSLLKDFCAFVSDISPDNSHVIAANEGGAVSLAAGHYLSSGSAAVVYLQNSGLGNCINPLLSLADQEVYSIPMILMIGWRGEPGKKDEPQHKKQGKVTIATLDVLGIPHIVLDKDSQNIREEIQRLIKTMYENSAPVAIVIREGAFEKYSLKKDVKTSFPFIREEAIKILLERISNADDVIVSTTGKASREIFESREMKHQHHGQDFLTVGSMGHASQIALGIAMTKSNKNIYCIDGDGAAIMHLGSIAIIGTVAPKNYYHIILNNGSHDSVGGQPTAGFDIDFSAIATACGYRSVHTATTEIEIVEAIKTMKNSPGPSLLEIKVNKGSRDNLGRPTTTTIENKNEFMEYLKR